MAKASTQLKKPYVTELIAIALLIVFGIIFITADYMADDVLSWIFGSILILYAILLLAQSYSETRSLTSVTGILSAFIGAFGVLFIVRNLASIIFAYIPYMMIFMGAYLIIDSIILITSRRKNDYTMFSIELVIGIASLVLGICLIFVDDFHKYTSLIFGIILLAIGAYNLIMFMFSRKK